MIEFDVDMNYLLEEGGLDCVILNDENCEHESMRFVRERTCHLETNCNTCSRCSECRYHVWHVYNFCPNCGARVVEE